jgi:WD40 repeat protein
VRCLAFSPGSQVLAFGGPDRLVHLWEARQGADEPEPVDPLLSRTALGISPDGRRLASLSAGTALRVWDLSTGGSVVELEGAPVLRAFTASPDGCWYAGSRAQENGRPEWQGGPAVDRATLGLWEAHTGRLRTVLEGQAAPITALAFAPDSRVLASAGLHSSDVWLWDVPAGQPKLILPGAVEGCSVEALVFQPRGSAAGPLLAVGGIDWLATSGSDGMVTLWDPAEGRMRASFRGGARCLAFHPDGQLLAGASLGQAIHVWNVAEGRQVGELLGHLEAVTCVAYSPDGRWLASGGDDRAVRLWDARSGLELGAQELDTQIKALAFTTDGRHLITGNGNTSCYVLEVQTILGAG